VKRKLERNQLTRFGGFSLSTKESIMKSLFVSRTFWASVFSFITGTMMLSKNPVAVTAAAILNDPSVQAQLLLIGGGVVHTVLRVATDKPVKVL
jgi:hypothetical protein